MKTATLFALVMLCIASPAQAKKVYKYTDETGKTIYSDEPIDGSKEIILPKAQTYSTPTIQTPSTGINVPKKEISYELAIIEPENNFVIQNGIESITVKVFAEPALQEYHVIQLFIDDKPFASPQKETSFVLSELARGSYELKAKIFDKKLKMKELKQSAPISIHVNRPMLPITHPNRALSILPFEAKSN